MPIKRWDDLPKAEQKEALLRVGRKDVGQKPGQWHPTAVISRIAAAGLQNDPDIVEHFGKEGIALPPTYSPSGEKR